MGNLVFATDIHLNFVKDDVIQRFCRDILKRNPSVVVLGGDLSEAPDLKYHLDILGFHLKSVPLYFVCGNHDYYRGSISLVRQNVLEKYFKSPPVAWLSTQGVVSLSKDTALVGHDGWYDGGYPEKNGDYFGSKLDMSDYHIIQELALPYCFNKKMRFDYINELSEQGAEHIREFLPKAFETHKKVFYVQHVSPFAETSCGPNRKMSDKDWMPHFCSRRTGEAILDVMKKQPAEKELIVLCGHSHTLAWHKPMPNVYCYCGQARYHFPAVAEQFKY